MCSCGLTEHCFPKLEAYGAKLEGNCHGISNPALFPSSFSLGGIFLNYVSPPATPKQLTKHSFRLVLSPAPGEELHMTASAKSQIQKVIQGQIPLHCELPSGTPVGD